MRFAVPTLIVGWLFLGACCMPAWGDGGSVCLSATTGRYRITVFSGPSPFRAGPVDISVLVQDASTGDPLPQTPVTVLMTKNGQPALAYPATQVAATNKLLRAAQFEVPVPGRWGLEVLVEGIAVVSGELEVAEPMPRWLEMWPWICWPGLAIILFGIHQLVVSGCSLRTQDPARFHDPRATDNAVGAPMT
jgi:hypothetical protein